MEKTMESNLPLCFVEQMAVLTSGALPLTQSEGQVSYVQSCNPTSPLKQRHHEVSMPAHSSVSKQYIISTAGVADSSGICTTVNTFPSILMSQTREKDIPSGIPASALDKLPSVLFSSLSGVSLPSSLPLYATNGGQMLTSTCDGADEVIPTVVDITSSLTSNLSLIPMSSSGVTILSTGGEENVQARLDSSPVTNPSLLVSSDTSMLPVNTGLKSLPTVQLPIVELLMETPSGEDLQENQEHLQIIEVIPVSSVHVYCVECNDSYIGGCNQHSTQYNHIPDSVIETRARASIPKCLHLREVNKHTGVFCNEDIPEKTLFGPLDGIRCSESDENKANSWQLFQNGSTVMYLDCSSEERSNWLMFMRRASNNAEQNVVVYQQGMELYYVTCKPVTKGCQLLYWYSADYAQLLGLPKRPDLLLYCNICHEQFISTEAMEGHKKKLHPNPTTRRRFCCPVCQKAFTSRHKVDVHMTKHTKLKPFICTECRKGFTDKSNLRKHMKIHKGEKNYRCLDCGRQFRQKSHLDTHTVIHTGEKHLVCTYCKKRFSRAGDLKQHTYIHTNDRNLECTVCSKVFHRRQNLGKHMKIHSSDAKHFPCPQCGKQFPDKYHRSRHGATCKGIKPTNDVRLDTGVELGLDVAQNHIQRRETEECQSDTENTIVSQ